MIYRAAGMFFAFVLIATALCRADQMQIVPTDSDRSAFAKGEAKQRAIDMFQDPRVCGIVILRERCLSDLDALIGGAGAAGNDANAERMRDFARTGDIDRFDKKWSDANSLMFPDAAWTSDPRETWLEGAGVVLESSYGPSPPMISQIMSLPMYKDLAKHAGTAGPYGTLIPRELAAAVQATAVPSQKDTTDGVLDDVQKVQDALLPALKTLFPSQAQPAVSVADTPKGDMQLGVYVASANEMFESPTLFLQPSSRAFLNSVALQLANVQLDPASAAQTRILAQGFLTANGPDDWKRFHADWQNLWGRALASLKTERKDAFAVGMQSAQIAYNAAILREAGPAQEQLDMLSGASLSSADVPGLADKRSAVVAAGPRDWAALNQAASALTSAIMSP